MSEMTAAADAEMGLAMRGDILAMREAETVWMCPECRDTGLSVRQTPDYDPRTGTGRKWVVECGCGIQRAAERRLERAKIPERYRTATLETLRTAGMDPSVGLALRRSREMAMTYPLVNRGLLLHGTCGTGKTHLAISILRYLVLDRAASARFWDLGDLLAQMKRSYQGVLDAPSESDLLDGLAGVDVLVLDELGAQRLTDWAAESVGIVLGQRYNSHRLTILTTNYPNLPAGAGTRGIETLGDRLGTRIWSRLQEMTMAFEMVGADYRTRKGATL